MMDPSARMAHGMMVQLHDTAKWNDGTMQWYNEMAQRSNDVTIACIVTFGEVVIVGHSQTNKRT